MNLLVNASIWLAVIVLGWAIVGRLTEAARSLGLTLFRPWRGDPWPIGVQEDDDARFDWKPAVPEAPTAARPASEDLPMPQPEPRATTRAASARSGVIEELDGEAVAAVSVSHVEVHPRSR